MYSVFRVHIVKLGEWRPINLHVRGRSDCMLLLVIDVQSVQYKQSRKDLKKKTTSNHACSTGTVLGFSIQKSQFHVIYFVLYCP